MSRILDSRGVRFDFDAEALIIGAGACGLTAALKAKDSSADVVVLERDASPSGSTAMSSGFIPAPGTRLQTSLDIGDSVDVFVDDLTRKAKGLGDPRLTRLAAQTIGPTLDWLERDHGLEWVLLTDFLYPGHSLYRMHATPEKTGEALEARLLQAVETVGAPIVTNAHVTALYTDGDRLAGVHVERPNGSIEKIGCRALVLACNGYGGNRDLVQKHIPQMADALYYGHAGNQGDAVLWGAALGANIQHMSACQGHGSLAHPHGILITWALMTEGGIQINSDGKRFSNEHNGYSEQAVPVLNQPDGIAWSLFDERLLAFARTFPDFKEAERAGAIKLGADAGALADAIGVPADNLADTISIIEAFATGRSDDPFGRDFTQKPSLKPPYYAVKVTGALFHTQGGLMIDDDARVLRPDGTKSPNLFAGGGAACGVSGPEISGYLSGNGLLTAVAFGALAGENAAGLAAAPLR